eukprot:1157094-Pelagomonas_calceolata.AAC.1
MGLLETLSLAATILPLTLSWHRTWVACVVMAILFLTHRNVPECGENWFQYLMLEENVSPAADQPDSRAVGQPL